MKKAVKKEKPPKIKAKVKRERTEKKRGRFALQLNFYLYLFVLFMSLVFTQALYSSLSAMMYIFVILLPFACLIYAVTALAAVKVYVSNSHDETSKFVPVDFEVNIVNDFILPYPFIEADIMVPNDKVVRCIEKRVQLSLAPAGYYNIAENVQFSYRGQYEIGISRIYIYDFFKMFRIALDVDTFTSIFVTPRRLMLEQRGDSAASDINTDSTNNILGIDRSELTDIRDYRNGDHMKNIHWKLSSKKQELMVKEFSMNSGKSVYVFVDMAAHYDTAMTDMYSDDINEYAADGIVELALAAAVRELRGGNSVTMIWYDHRVESRTQKCQLQTLEDLNVVFKTFSTVGLCGADENVVNLAALVEETQAVTMIFVTGSLDENLVSSLTQVSANYGTLVTQGALDVYYYNPSEKVYDPTFKERTEACRDQLSANAIGFYETKF